MSSAFYISAAHKSSGKTMMSIGLCRALAQHGQQVQPFKKGPDFIDPMWLGRAAGHACYNLDFYTSSQAYIEQQFQRSAHNRDVIVVEGNKGLYDGLDLHGTDSNAAMAKLLGLPVILVLDCRGMTRGVAPLLQGYQAFDPTVNIAGVILNRTGGSRHRDKLRNVIEHYCDIPVLGMVPVSRHLEMTERHLGLIPSNEIDTDIDSQINALAAVVSDNVDLGRLLTLTEGFSVTTLTANQSDVVIRDDNKLRIGIARDNAFGFYYPDDLEQFERHGAQLIPFDCLHDNELPGALDGLIFGGGFPESVMLELQANQSLRASIKQAIENGLPSYAECGGLMYLSRSIEWQQQKAEMVGVIPGEIKMHRKPQGRGYVQIQRQPSHIWPASEVNQDDLLCAHEFHHSSLHLDENHAPQYAYGVERGHGITGLEDGLVVHNLLASYSHLRQTDRCHWVSEFVAFVRRNKALKQEPD